MPRKPKRSKEQSDDRGTPVGFRAGTGEYVVPKYKEWAESHRIEQRGTDDGREGFPPANHGTPDQTHNEIRTYVTELATGCRGEVTQYLGDLMGSINQVHDEAGLEIIKGRSKQIADGAQGDYDNQAGQDTAVLKPALEEYRAQEIGLAEFRREHQIGARLADDSKHREAWLWIAAIMLAESTFNAFMLADVSPAGLAGALSMTVIITAVNTLCGVFFVGEGWRSSNSVRDGTRVRGYVQVVVIGLFLIAFNILVGHGRDAMQMLEAELRGGAAVDAFSQVSVNAWTQFLEAPFRFESFKAPLLTVAGIVCCALASWKGYERDDWYPGYGAISRKAAEVREEYQALREDATTELKTRHGEATKTLDDLLNEAQWKRDEYDNLCDLGRKACKEYPLQMQRYAGYLRDMVQMYRDANVKARDGSDVPEYFAQEMTLDAALFKAPEFSPPAKPAVADLAEAVGEQKERLQKHYDQLLAATYPPR